MRQRAALLMLVAATVLIPQVAHACPVCFGDVGGPVARGVNNGILTMLGVVFTLQLGFGVMFVGMVRRAKRLAENQEDLAVTKRGRG
jgi:hypothetical protein